MDNRVNLVFLSIYWALKHKVRTFLQKEIVLRFKNQTLSNIHFQKLQPKTTLIT